MSRTSIDASLLSTANRILQIVRVQVNSTTTTSSTSYVDSGLSATITPKFSTSKVLVFCYGNLSINNVAANDNGLAAIFRGATDITSGTDRGLKMSFPSTGNHQAPCTYITLDSPATTSATTYKVRIKTDNASSLAGWGASGGTGNTSEMILVEVGQ